LTVNIEDQLAKLSRYEALFELTGAINASMNLDETCEIMARRLKYVADVFAWRYLSVNEGGAAGHKDAAVIIIDGFRGRAEIVETDPSALSSLETRLWDERRAQVLCEGANASEIEHLPDHFRRPDVSQIYAHPLLGAGEQRALFVFCKRREPFSDLDMKFVSLVCAFFHRRLQMLWEQRKLRELEMAYLQQEVTLRQSEKLATLGRLSAGMAHELNNPASAARRSTEQLREEVGKLASARFALGAQELTDEQLAAIGELETVAGERAREPAALDALERSDLEERLEDWLDEHGVDEPWEHAAALAAMGERVERLEELTSLFDADGIAAVVAALGSCFNVYRLLEEMGHGTTRISEIVRALKSYSYMDQAPVQEVDVRKGLDDTLVMLRSKLKDGIRVERDYAEDLPQIQAYGSELNQVWTNIVDNAVTAMDGSGELKLKVYSETSRVAVEITDSGAGIPAEILDNVFDPFFTTKAPGEGTGLGLNISHNIIVQKHGGEISAASRPGLTVFTVKLPLTLETQERAVEGDGEESSPETLRQAE